MVAVVFVFRGSDSGGAATPCRSPLAPSLSTDRFISPGSCGFSDAIVRNRYFETAASGRPTGRSSMFSGIVEALGTIVELRPEPPGCRLIVREAKIAAETRVADSISVNGCCLTVVEREGDTFGFQAGPETLARTNLGDLKPGSRVESRTGLGRRPAVGRAFRQRTHRRRGHAAAARRLRRLVDVLVLGAAALGRADGLERLDRRQRRESDHRRLRARPFQHRVDPLHLGRHHAWPLAARRRVNLETDLLAKYVQRLVEAKEWP